MDKPFDVVVRRGSLVDGSGAAAFEADVAIKDGRIAAVGDVRGKGREEIDARGKLVTPGFVDIHTHYDGQATWDERMQPSSLARRDHGGDGQLRRRLRALPTRRPRATDPLMEGVEDIPFPVLTAGPAVGLGEFPDYLDALEHARFDVDIGAQLPHAALRVYVMGERGAQREPATRGRHRARWRSSRSAPSTPAPSASSTSRTLNHRTSDGQPTPTLSAGEDELTGIALGLRAAAAAAACCSSSRTSPMPTPSSPCCAASWSARAGRCRSRWCSTRATQRSGSACSTACDGATPPACR